MISGMWQILYGQARNVGECVCVCVCVVCVCVCVCVCVGLLCVGERHFSFCCYGITCLFFLFFPLLVSFLCGYCACQPHSITSATSSAYLSFFLSNALNPIFKGNG